MKVLYLTIKRKWFDMIASGERLEEYREVKPYWANRILHRIELPHGGYWSAWSDIQKGYYSCSDWLKFTGGAPIFTEFAAVQFRNGYRPDSPTLLIECKGIDIGPAVPEWSDNWQGDVFRIKLGEIIKKP